jgi:hypothetical protein
MSRAIGLLLLLAACGDNVRLRPDASFPDDATPDAALDTTPPDTAITQAPPAPRVGHGDVRVPQHRAGDRFECTVDDGAFTACASPATFTVADGAHSFGVRAIDRAGNVDASPASFAWRVDTQAPDTMITQSPPAAANSATATFAFNGSEAGDRFECAVDAAAFTACTSPATFTVADGAHSFGVRAIDEVGNTDASPATFAWTVDTQPAVCGDGAAHGAEVCDGADLRGATCASLGHAPGTLACAADCTGYDATACTGNYDPANARFTGTVCFNGLKFSTPNLTFALRRRVHRGQRRVQDHAGQPDQLEPITPAASPTCAAAGSRPTPAARRSTASPMRRRR